MEKTSLLSQWKEKKKAETPSKSIGKAPDKAAIPLSYSQRRLWFLQQLHPDNPFYNYTEEYRFTGDLQVDKLLDALKLVFKSHDILRTLYYLEDGRPFMRIAEEADVSKQSSAAAMQEDGAAPEPLFKVSRHDLRDKEDDQNAKDAVDAELQRLRDADAKHNFDLSRSPVALMTIVRVREDAYHIFFTLHHIATDKWSMNLLREEWARYFRELSDAKHPEPRSPKVQYPDFAYWQRNRSINQQQLDYWKQKLAGDIPLLDLSTDRPRPKTPSFAGQSSEFRPFSAETSKAILQSCKKMGITPYVFFLSSYYLFLYRYTGQSDILIGSPISNRDQKQLEDTIGFFNDTLVLRTEIPAESSFSDLVREVKKTTLEAFSNKEVPFDLLVRELGQERSLSINPFFQVMFLYYSVPEAESFGAEVKMEHNFYNPGVSKFDLTFDVAENKGILSFSFEYSTELFDAKTIARFQKHIARLVEGVVERPESPLSEIEMLGVEEKEFLFPKIGEGTDTFKEFTGIHQCIEKMAATKPEVLAVSFRDDQITYGELETKAASLAVRILEHTKSENAVVGLCVTRSLEMITGLYAILKAGCAYMPIDPKYPAERIDFMMRDADVGLLVTQSGLAARFENSAAVKLFVDASYETDSITEPNSIDSSDSLQTRKISPRQEWPISKRDNLAYVIYTSGSTGRPKGVPITHGNILNSTAGRLDFYPENPEAFLLLSSISFDSSKAGIFWTLCTGGNLIVTEDRVEQDMDKLGKTIRRNEVTHMLLLPTLYQLLLEHADAATLKTLTTVMVAGEACSPSVVERHFKVLPETGLYNEYGPTEASVWCIAHKIQKQDASGAVPLGRPVANSEIYLLDTDKNLVPVGAAGEIYIGGAGLSGSYLNRPELTAKAYVEHPFWKGTANSNGGDVKLYKTGDLARCKANGDIEFLGRSDQQVKIRGYRVELGEIEKAMRTKVGASQVIVLAEGNGGSAQRIAAYLTADRPIEIPELKKSLKQKLPAYMIPSSITQVETFPRLPNGKMDTSALKKLKGVGEAEVQGESQPPRTETERSLHAIWQELLKVEDIGIHDNFFDLGGDSILSIRLIAKARKAGIQLTPNQIFDNQTIASLASYIAAKEKQAEEWDYLVALRKEGSEKPLFCIHAGGGHVFFYNVLTKYIAAQRPIYALQASGVYADTEMHHSIEAMARDYLQAIRSVQPEGPYNIMVYCFSVAVGHEMSIQLSEAGQTANLIVMDTMTDPWKLNTNDRLRLRIKSFVKRLASDPVRTIRGMIGERIIGLRLKLRKLLSKGDDKALARMNDNLAHICAEYAWRPHQGKVNLLITEKPDEAFNKEVIGSWKKVTLGGVEIVPIKGNHIDLFAEPEVAGVAQKIEENSI